MKSLIYILLVGVCSSLPVEPESSPNVDILLPKTTEQDAEPRALTEDQVAQVDQVLKTVDQTIRSLSGNSPEVSQVLDTVKDFIELGSSLPDGWADNVPKIKINVPQVSNIKLDDADLAKVNSLIKETIEKISKFDPSSIKVNIPTSFTPQVAVPNVLPSPTIPSLSSIPGVSGVAAGSIPMINVPAVKIPAVEIPSIDFKVPAISGIPSFSGGIPGVDGISGIGISSEDAMKNIKQISQTLPMMIQMFAGAASGQPQPSSLSSFKIPSGIPNMAALNSIQSIPGLPDMSKLLAMLPQSGAASPAKMQESGNYGATSAVKLAANKLSYDAQNKNLNKQQAAYY